MVGSYRTFKATDITADGFVSGEIRATNNVVSSSQQITNYYKFAETASANTFYGNQSISGTLTATGTITMNKTGGYGILAQDDGNNLAANGAYIGWTNIAANRYFIGQLDTNNDLNYHYFNGSTWATSIMKFTNAGGASFADNIVMASGKGIDFSATANSAGTMTSELLNDYEEGTWTPVITDLTNDATMDGTYTRGSYIKIGKQVTVRGYILTTSLGSVTGNVKIKGLPFTNGGGFASLGGGSIGTASGLNITAGHSVHISTPLGSNHLGINVGDDAGGTTEMTAAEWSADGQVQMLATYFVD
jgi:hypothetical protein